MCRSADSLGDRDKSRADPVMMKVRCGTTHSCEEAELMRMHSWRPGRALGIETLESRLALATMLPVNFTETPITTNTNLNRPTAMDFSPTGQLWVLEQGGAVKV